MMSTVSEGRTPLRGTPGPDRADIAEHGCRAAVPSRPAPREFGLLGFDHVDVRVRDRAKAQRFFVEQLGMDVIGEGSDHTYLLFGDQVLGLRDAKDGETFGGVGPHRLPRERMDRSTEPSRACSRHHHGRERARGFEVSLPTGSRRASHRARLAAGPS